MEIFTFKLVSGDEIIAKVVAIEADHYMISEPAAVGATPQGMGLIPALLTAKPDGEIRLNTSSVCLVAPTDENIKTKYIKATTGLDVPSKKIVMG